MLDAVHAAKIDLPQDFDTEYKVSNPINTPKQESSNADVRELVNGGYIKPGSTQTASLSKKQGRNLDTANAPQGNFEVPKTSGFKPELKEPSLIDTAAAMIKNMFNFNPADNKFAYKAPEGGEAEGAAVIGKNLDKNKIAYKAPNGDVTGTLAAKPAPEGAGDVTGILANAGGITIASTGGISTYSSYSGGSEASSGFSGAGSSGSGDCAA